MFDIQFYKTPLGNIPFQKYLEKLKKQHKDDEVAEVLAYIDKLKEYGFEINKEFKPEAIKPLRDKVYELRPSSSRIFFFCYIDGKFVILHGYEKKTNKTDKLEIECALREKDDYIKR